MFSTDSSLVNPVPWREAGLMTQTQHGALRAIPGGQARDDLADRYARDGYAILPGAFTTAEVAQLRAEALRICRGDLGPVAGMEAGPADEDDEAVIRRYACIHFPHKLSPLMRQTLAHPALVGALTRVIGPDVKAMRWCCSTATCCTARFPTPRAAGSAGRWSTTT
jgi:phytanoyl-CoA hydroxylase